MSYQLSFRIWLSFTSCLRVTLRTHISLRIWPSSAALPAPTSLRLPCSSPPCPPAILHTETSLRTKLPSAPPCTQVSLRIQLSSPCHPGMRIYAQIHFRPPFPPATLHIWISLAIQPSCSPSPPTNRGTQTVCWIQLSTSPYHPGTMITQTSSSVTACHRSGVRWCRREKCGCGDRFRWAVYIASLPGLVDQWDCVSCRWSDRDGHVCCYMVQLLYMLS